MFMARSSQNGNFGKGKLNPFGNIELSPSAGVLNYGQVFFFFLFFELISQMIT